MKKLILIALAVCATRLVSAAEVTAETATRAAEGFVTADAVGKVVLAGCTVDSVVARGRLWIAHLAPSGHVILSGSDLVDPIVGFSKNDFVEPDPESPAFAVLEGADASVAAREAQGGGTRHERWTKLLGGGTSKKGLLKAADVESPDTVVIPPFLESHYDQWQPYNDYSPVHEPDENYFKSGYEPYRGRCPCGCVATAAAQGFRHFRWPARMDRVDSFNHNFTDTNRVVVTTPFPLRFDGHLPMDWAALEDDYDSDSGGEWIPDPERPGTGWQIWKSYTDLRGTVPEATRYPIARLIMFADVLAHMSFGADGSSANYGTVALNVSDWYTLGTWVTADDARVLADITNGVPVQISIPGHAVVGHGWATDGGNQYIYLNYGWGGGNGGNDGYYNINGSTIQQVYVGHYPRAKPQIDPLPKVCGTDFTLNWHFPDFYTNKLDGFVIAVQKTCATPSTFLDVFSVSQGVSTAGTGSINNGNYDKLYIGTDMIYGQGKDELLYAEPLAVGTFTFDSVLTLTGSSILSFDLRSVNANACIYEIQASFDGGEWTTLLSPKLTTTPDGYTRDSGWQRLEVDLGSHAGQIAVFRINKAYAWGSDYYYSGRVLLDNFQVSNVLLRQLVETSVVSAAERSHVFSALENGVTYTFAVTPSVASDCLVDGETSQEITTVIGNATALAMPEILSVTTVDEGFYAECGTNATAFTVQCSPNVATLRAFPSHLSLVRDEDVAVVNRGGGQFDVTVTPSGINETNFRSRLILTLVGTDANGTKCYKDLSLRFEPVAVTASEVQVDITPADGEPYSVCISYDWLETYLPELSGASGASAYEAAAVADSDGDGLPNWAEYVCGTSPTNSNDKLSVTIRMENGQPVVETSPTAVLDGFRAVKKGSNDLKTWTGVTETKTSPYHFFKVVIEPVNP